MSNFLKTRRNFMLSGLAVTSLTMASLLPNIAYGQTNTKPNTNTLEQNKTPSILDLPATPPQARIWYGDNINQFGDFRKPDKQGKFPLAIIIHGGYWRNKYNLDYLSHFCDALTQEGIATWNIEYRRIGDAGGAYPGTFQDVANAVDFVSQLNNHCLVNNAIDINNVIIIGHSAGGHLGAWAASRSHISQDDILFSKNPLKLKGMISLAGLLDLEYAEDQKLSDSATTLLLEGAPKNKIQRYRYTSPINMLAPDTKVALFHGTKDIDVPIEISKLYAEKCKEQKIQDVELNIIENVDHYDLIDPRSQAWNPISTKAKELFK